MRESMLVTMHQPKKSKDETVSSSSGGSQIAAIEVAYSPAPRLALIMGVIVGCSFHFSGLGGQVPGISDWLCFITAIGIFILVWVLLALTGWGRGRAASRYRYDGSLVFILLGYTVAVPLIFALFIYFLAGRMQWPALLTGVLLPILVWLWSFLRTRPWVVQQMNHMWQGKNTTLVTLEELMRLKVDDI